MAGLRRGLVVALAGLALTLLFVLLLFPFDRYRSLLEHALGSALDAQVQVGSLAPALGLRGPALRARDLRIRLADGATLTFDELRGRPALSGSWLRGDPALRLWATGPEGGVDGTVWLGERSGFSGSLRDVDLELLGRAGLAEDLALRGRADVDLDLSGRPEGLEGHVTLAARDGSLALPPYGVPVTFATAEGRFELQPEQGLRVDSFALQDPALSLQAEGTIGLRPSLERGPLDLRAELEVRDPDLRNLIAQAVPLDRNGSTRLELEGSLAEPFLR